MPILPVSEIQTVKDRADLGAAIPTIQQSFSVLTFSGKKEKLLSLNKNPNQVPWKALGYEVMDGTLNHITPLCGYPQQVRLKGTLQSATELHLYR